MENDLIRINVGAEGAHMYGWYVKGLNNVDLTAGTGSWAGFADVAGTSEVSPNKFQVLDSGPVVARVKCTDQEGMEKTFTLWAGVPWVEVSINCYVESFMCYDNIKVMGADSSTPGSYLFADGTTGRLKKTSANGNECQIYEPNVHWGAKDAAGGAALAVIVPEASAPFMVGPGGPQGGVNALDNPNTCTHS